MVKFDDLGPEKILEVYNPKLGMRGFVVIDNTILGPAKGGIRMTPTVSVGEVCRLARAMTYKCAIAGLPFGGGKSGIVADPKSLTREKKDEFVAEFARAIKSVCPSLYVAGPDMNTTEHEMQVFAKANGDLSSCTGKPKELGGLPHELGSTGFGVFHATLVALGHMKLDVKSVRVAIEGFGNVGFFVAKFLASAGAKIVAVSDSKGVVEHAQGIDFATLERVKKDTGSVVNYPQGMKAQDILSVDCDVLVTAAIPDLVKESDAGRIKAKLIVEGSNIPMVAKVEELLHKKGVLVIPDFVANAGGVISSYVEFIMGTESDMWKIVEEKITTNTRTVLELTSPTRSPRKAAVKLAKSRLKKA